MPFPRCPVPSAPPPLSGRPVRLLLWLCLRMLLLQLHFAELNATPAPSPPPPTPDPQREHFPFALLNLAAEFLGGEGKGRQTPNRVAPTQHRRESRFFGESARGVHGAEVSAQHSQSPASFSRTPAKTRDEQERDLEDELKAEFVRVSLKNDPNAAHRFRKKTFTTMPRPFECYSCMSQSYQNKWLYLQSMYFAPKAFTDACDETIHKRSQIPTVLCASFCVSMLEPNVEAGIFVGFKYIRGCGDRILRHGFNSTAIQIHRFNQLDRCLQLPRESLFNRPRQLEVGITGNLQICTCYGERCNSNAPSSARGTTGARFPAIVAAQLFTTAMLILLIRNSL